jgi:hypothetical protein
MALPDGTTIGRLRIRTSSADPDAVRMRGAAALRSLDLQPPSMPAQAILCIRTLRDPLPGGVDLRWSHAPRPETWERAARTQIASIMRRAIRPAFNSVPESADAVLFSDRSELLACAARAAAEGLLQSQWWWEHLFVARTPDAVGREWQRSLMYVPAAVELLARDHRLDTLARVIPATETVRLIAALFQAQALNFVAEQLSGALSAPATSTRPRGASISVSAPSVPPWQAIAPEVERQPLPLEHRVLAAVALILRRRPSIARSESFVQQAISWITAVRGEPDHREATSPPATASHRKFVPPKFAADQIGEPPSVTSDVAQSAQSRKEGMRIVPTGASPALHARQSAAETRAAPPVESAAERVDDAAPFVELPSSSSSIPQQSVEALSPAASKEARRDDSVVIPPIVPDLVIQSAYGGVFFLLNLFIAMELYSDFTTPVQRGLDFNLWHFLATVARELTDEKIEDDPIWPFLQTLAGDEDPDPIDAGQLADLLEKIREPLSIFENPDFLIRRFARITVSPAHLDVHFSLAAHPIEVRMAGLDRDPGWMPAAARHVSFHFE